MVALKARTGTATWNWTLYRRRIEKMWRLRQVIDGPLWALLRDFRTSEDVLYVRRTGIKWNVARFFGSFAEFFFFLLKKDGTAKPVPPPEWCRLRYAHLRLWDPGQLPGLAVLACPGERGPEQQVGKL